jgi:membrane protease YdiL (CAAX protease family)
MMTGIFLVEWGTGCAAVEWRGLGVWEVLWLMASAAVFFLVAAVWEEVLFRGYLFQTLMQGITFLPAMIVMAVFFAVGHMNNPNASTYGIINVGLAAIWLSFAYLKTRGLWLPCGLHFGWNFTQTSIYGFPTSGADFTDKTIVRLTQSGPEWITGGAFGPEGGVLATLALIFCTWYILKSRLLAAPEGILTLDSVEDLIAPVIDKSGDAAV